MVRQVMLTCAALFVASHASLGAQQGAKVDLKEWDVEWGGRTRDPAVAPDGKVWFVGQAGNYIAWFDPKTAQFKRFEIEEGTNPHSINVDSTGIVWYTGNRNGRIGRLDPNGGGLRVIMTGEAKDPHTHVFDGKGNMWFTSQGSNKIGRLNMKTEKVDLITPSETPSNPYGIVLDPQGNPWVALFRTNTLVRINPATLEVTRFTQANAPGGAGSRPYALTKDDQGRLWFSETGPVKQLVGFDPKTEKFFSVNPVSGTIRHMHFHAPTKAMWFGTDANKIGRVITSSARS
jgi:virginiamycin B lyase